MSTERTYIITSLIELEKLIAEKSCSSDYLEMHEVCTKTLVEIIRITTRRVLKMSAAFPGVNDIDYDRLGLVEIDGVVTVNFYTKFVFQTILDKAP